MKNRLANARLPVTLSAVFPPWADLDASHVGNPPWANVAAFEVVAILVGIAIATARNAASHDAA